MKCISRCLSLSWSFNFLTPAHNPISYSDPNPTRNRPHQPPHHPPVSTPPQTHPSPLLNFPAPQVLDGQYYERNGEPKCALHAVVPDSVTECKVCARAVDDGDAVWYVLIIFLFGWVWGSFYRDFIFNYLDSCIAMGRREEKRRACKVCARARGG